LNVLIISGIFFEHFCAMSVRPAVRWIAASRRGLWLEPTS